jgi:hypothetical protein
VRGRERDVSGRRGRENQRGRGRNREGKEIDTEGERDVSERREGKR